MEDAQANARKEKGQIGTPAEPQASLMASSLVSQTITAEVHYTDTWSEMLQHDCDAIANDRYSTKGMHDLSWNLAQHERKTPPDQQAIRN